MRYIPPGMVGVLAQLPTRSGTQASSRKATNATTASMAARASKSRVGFIYPPVCEHSGITLEHQLRAA